MTTELQNELDAIRAECRRVIELSELATPGPWIRGGSSVLSKS